MEFVPVVNYEGGKKVLFCRWETRVQDFRRYVADTGYKQKGGAYIYKKGDGWKEEASASWENPGQKQGEDHPVTCVNWDEAKAFCAWLSKRDGVTYRLPTDVEWSYAVGIGTKEDANATPEEKGGKAAGYPWGDDFPPPAGSGNYRGGTAAKELALSGIEGYDDGYAFTAPVGEFRANRFGLHDLGGNAWEWCEDWYSGDREYRVLRGGSWSSLSETYLRSSYRNNDHPTNRNDNNGFRVVVEVGGKATPSLFRRKSPMDRPDPGWAPRPVPAEPQKKMPNPPSRPPERNGRGGGQCPPATGDKTRRAGWPCRECTHCPKVTPPFAATLLPSCRSYRSFQ